MQGKANILTSAIIEMTGIAKALVILSHELKLLRILKGKRCSRPIANL